MEQVKLKLNVKNTFKLGLAFFAILMLWQIYNTYCPIILKTFLGEEHNYLIGVIMALDNVAAIFIMPIFGNLSDKTHSKYGKRMPYIVIGMLLTMIVFPLIGVLFKMNSFAGCIVMMGLFLVIMQSYRNPAVAFMPDITPKPLRSTANGIINLVGYIGGVFASVVGMIFAIKDGMSNDTIRNVVLWPFIICSIVLVIVLIVLVLTINENKLLEETKDEVALGEKQSEALDTVEIDKPLSKADLKNFIILLISIFLWFMSFNAFETFGSLYGKEVLGNSSITSLMGTILSVVSILTFVLFSSLSNKLGRKLTIAIGLVAMIIALVSLALVSMLLSKETLGNAKGSFLEIFYYVMAAIMGVGWALINVNSFPMAVEYANPSNLGKFTGYYYIASMLAQSITPILVGVYMDIKSQYNVLFVYSSVLMIVAFIFFIFIKEKISIKERRAMIKTKKSALENLGDIDN